MEMFSDSAPRRVAVLGSYVPRRCGIATFSSDLRDALLCSGDCEVDVLAVDDDGGHEYPDEVVFSFSAKNVEEYDNAATFLNEQQYQALFLQHEFGLYGGPAGRDLLVLLRQLKMPIVTTLHTVLAKPDESLKKVMEELVSLSQKLVVMNSQGIEILQKVYGASRDQIELIPHGIPDFSVSDGRDMREKLGVKGPMILTFGLLSPDKGIQYVIEALPQILEACPTATYHVLGATHPHVKAHAGESYRGGLVERAEELGVDHAVHFHDRYASKEELVEFLAAADIYITPYLNPQQITSGTLAYAVGAGKAVISTPYLSAVDLLGEGRGVLVPFRCHDAIADAVCCLTADEAKLQILQSSALEYGRSMLWPQVGEQYWSALETPRMSAVEATPAAPQTTQPPLILSHLHAMTDNVGLLQHALYTIPNRLHGYCVDDNARALALVSRLSASREDTEIDALERTFLTFTIHGWNPTAGRFRNFMGYDRQWMDEDGGDDAYGRAVLALATTAGRSRLEGHRAAARTVVDQSFSGLSQTNSPRAWALGVLALDELDRAGIASKEMRRTAEELALRLQKQYLAERSEEWLWFESIVSYANARLPQALMVAGGLFNRPEMIDQGLSALRWLMDVQTARGGEFLPVGSNGFYPRGGRRADYDQQPLEAWVSLSACLTAGRITGEARWFNEADHCLTWFTGQNTEKISLIDEKTGGCRDGLHVGLVNENQGAESTLAWLLALQEMEEAYLVKKPRALVI